MTNINMALINEHFLHGHVAELWCEEFGNNFIIVINDQLSKNKMHQGLLDMSVPEGIICRYYSLDKAMNTLNKLDPLKQPILIFQNLEDLKVILDAGFDIPVITLSNVAPTPGSRIQPSGVSLSSKQTEWLLSLEERFDTTIEIRNLPTDESIELNEQNSI